MKLAICGYCEQPLLPTFKVCPRCEMKRRANHSLLWYCCAASLLLLVGVLSGVLLR